MSRFDRYRPENRFTRYVTDDSPSPGSGWQRELGAFASAAADSLSLGFGDELWGIANGLGAAAQGGDFRTAQRSAEQRARDRLRDAWRYHSGAALGGALVGALPLGFGLGAMARAPATAARLASVGPVGRLGSAVLHGAGWGGLYGLGSSDGALNNSTGVMQRLGGAGLGAALGGGTGAALQGVGMGLGHMWRNVVRPGFDPSERAVINMGEALQRSGMTTPQQFADEAAKLARMERTYAPGSDPMVMDALGEAGTGMAMVAGARQSAGRVELQRAMEGRNAGVRERVDNLLVRILGGGKRQNVAKSLEELEDIQRSQAAPLFAEAHAQTLGPIPQRLRDFVTFNDRSGAAFKGALEAARESMRRVMGVNASDDQMVRSPVFWHRLLEHSTAAEGAAIQAARVSPVGAPLGSVIPEMTQDVRALNRAVRQLLGGEGSAFDRAMNMYAGSARLQRAWEVGYRAFATEAKGELNQAGFARSLSRMSESEREAMRSAAISGLRDAMKAADTGTGKADVMRALIGNEAKRDALKAIFGSDTAVVRVLRTLDYERKLFLNYQATNIGRGSPTADKLMGQAQVFSPNEIGGLTGIVRRVLGREARDQYDEQLANEVLRLLRMPVSGAGAPRDLVAYAQGRGLLARSMRNAQWRKDFRRRVGPLAGSRAAVGAIGLGPDLYV